MSALAAVFLAKLMDIPALAGLIIGVFSARWLTGLLAAAALGLISTLMLMCVRSTPLDAPAISWFFSAVAVFVAYAIGQLLRRLWTH